jgi:hypothetical protein
MFPARGCFSNKNILHLAPQKETAKPNESRTRRLPELSIQQWVNGCAAAKS